MRICPWFAMLLSSLPGLSVTGQAVEASGHHNESQLLLTWADTGLWIAGHVRDVQSGDAVAEVLVHSGPASGVVTDSLGWFRVFQDIDMPHELRLEKIGYATVRLEFEQGERKKRFFFQSMNFESCERIKTVGHPWAPNEVVVLVRDLRTGKPISGRSQARIQRAGELDSTSQMLDVRDGRLTLPVSRSGVYSVALLLPGFEEWSHVLIVPYDVCDENSIGFVREVAWLIPRREGGSSEVPQA